MTYFVTAYNNRRQMIIESETRTSDPVIADLVELSYKARGFHVRRWSEA